MGYYERIEAIADALRPKIGDIPDTAVVLGSGLGAFADAIVREKEIPYAEIPDFPVSTAPGHAGKLIVGKIGKKRILAFQGRFHLYEGYSPETVTRYIRVLALLGVRNLILTNAAGAMNTDFKVGDLMLIQDHISLFCRSPLFGENDERFGVRFPSMTFAYDRDLQKIARDASKECGVPLRTGVYAYTPGPMFETPAEVRALRILGGDACGMSTVPEAIVANHVGLRVLGISCLTNMAAGILDCPLTLEEVMTGGKEAEIRIRTLLTAICEKL